MVIQKILKFLFTRMGVTLHGSGHGHSHGLGGGHAHSHGGNESHGHSHGGNESHAHSHGSGGGINDGDVAGGSDLSDDTEELLKETKSKLKKDLNVRAAFVHVLGDLVQSVGVFIAALVIYFKVGTRSSCS